MNPNLPTGETMSEGSDMPSIPAMPASLEQCVPLESLAQPDDADELTQPEIGDAVDFTVSGKVTRIDGDMAFVMPETINGKEVAAPPASETGDTLESLQTAAQAMT